MADFGAIAVTGLGMASSLGHGVVQACAAARAGILRATDLPETQVYDQDLLEPATLRGHPVRGMEGFEGLGKLAFLCAEALRDLRCNASFDGLDTSSTALFLNLSSGYFIETMLQRLESAAAKHRLQLGAREEEAARRQRVEAQLIPRAAALSGLSFHPRYQRVLPGGHAGFMGALAAAAQLLHTRTVAACVVGGVDSLLEPRLLRILLELRVLKTPDNPVGLMPGEAGAFVLLERADEARRRGAKVEAILESPNVTQEKSDHLSGAHPSGVALADVIRNTLRETGAAPADFGLVHGSLNGEAWRANDWGMAQVRLSRELGEARLWNPAASFGEIGAATAAVATCAAARAFQRGYSLGKRILIWSADDDGARGAVSMRASEDGTTQRRR